MGSNRRGQERERAAAERNAANQAREIVLRAQRAIGRRRMRQALIREALIAIVVALLFGVLWKQLIVLLAGVAVP